jgi:hypothetical protein
MSGPGIITRIDRSDDDGDYADVCELAVIFNHEIVRDASGVRRFKRVQLLDRFFHEQCPVYLGEWAGPASVLARGSINMNHLWDDFLGGAFPLEEFVKFYMQIGYSLGGFVEVFGTRMPHLLETYRGQVLKI